MRAVTILAATTDQATAGEVAVVAFCVGAFVLAVLLLLRIRPITGSPQAARQAPAAHDPSRAAGTAAPVRPALKLPAVVVNPTKFPDVDAVRLQISRVCAELGWADPLWLTTTQADPGEGQARRAVAEGADLVMACGGDGTVRSVAQALAGSGVPMGLLPTGTGNLLARNLDMRLDDLLGAVRTALSGRDRRVDVGRMVVDDRPEQVFLVMAGMGFDALIMQGAQADLKAKVGSAAYVVAGARHLNGRRVRLTLSVDDGKVIHRRSRMVVVGNCGRLLGGLVLMPDAQVDDGLLDVVSLSPKGIVGWAAIAGRLVTRQRKGHALVERWVGRTVTISAAEPQISQVDGDPMGEATVLRIRVDPGALVVRVSRGSTAVTSAQAVMRALR